MRVVIIPSMVFFLAYCKGVLACPAGWTDAGSGLCLTFQTDLKSWDNAQATCSAMNGHLTDITSKDENVALTTFRLDQAQQGDPVWLGMRKQIAGWQWTDGSHLTWTSWKGGVEPDGLFDCGILETAGSGMTWSAYPCDAPLSFICCYKEKNRSLTKETKVFGNWHKLTEDQRYSGPGNLLTVTSPSSLSCVVLCQSTDTCNAVIFEPKQQTCQLIAGRIDASHLLSGPDNEVWVQKI